MSNVLVENQLQHKCYHIIPCAVTKEMREWAATKLEEARNSGDEYRVVIAIAQLTGPCVIDLLSTKDLSRAA
jgi:hypothetical protein